MTEQKNALARLFAACWKDEALKARFMADPKAVLKEHGLGVSHEPSLERLVLPARGEQSGQGVLLLGHRSSP